MTLAEFDEKIAQLEIIQASAVAMQLSDITELIDDLSLKRVELITSPLINMEQQLTSDDIEDFNSIAEAFDNGTAEIEEVNNLIDKAITIGRKLLI
tara:strand:+ start:1072 stop:1359 length:288 start_codon:yes stop_codon:yes gene_type:complete